MKAFSILKRAISLLVVVCFLTTNVQAMLAETTAYGVRSTANEIAVKIPVGIGSVVETYIAPRTEYGVRRKNNESKSPYALPRTVIYIQDAHDSLEAQENIAAMVRHCVKEYGVKTVYEEGYEGSVPTDELFAPVQDPALKEKISYYLMDKLRIGGAEYAHINRLADSVEGIGYRKNKNNEDPFAKPYPLNPNWQLIGADSIALHLENIRAYEQSAKKRGDVTKDIQRIRKELRKLIDRDFSREMKEWLALKSHYQKGELSLIDYLKRSYAVRSTGYGVRRKNNDSNFPYAVRLPPYPSIEQLLSSDAKQIKQIDLVTLMGEIQALEDAIVKAGLPPARDRKTYGYYQSILLLEKLNAIELSHEEFESLKDSLQGLKTEDVARFIAKESRRSLVLFKSWEELIADSINFYEQAKLRDEAIDKILEDSVEGIGYRENENSEKTSAKPYPLNPNVSVLVFGGFHKEAIKRILKEKGISYVILAPVIGAPSKRHKDYYQMLMSGGLHAFEKTEPRTTGHALRQSMSVDQSKNVVRASNRPANIFLNPDASAIISRLAETAAPFRSELRQNFILKTDQALEQRGLAPFSVSEKKAPVPLNAESRSEAREVSREQRMMDAWKDKTLADIELYLKKARASMAMKPWEFYAAPEIAGLSQGTFKEEARDIMRQMLDALELKRKQIVLEKEGAGVETVRTLLAAAQKMQMVLELLVALAQGKLPIDDSLKKENEEIVFRYRFSYEGTAYPVEVLCRPHATDVKEARVGVNILPDPQTQTGEKQEIVKDGHRMETKYLSLVSWRLDWSGYRTQAEIDLPDVLGEVLPSVRKHYWVRSFQGEQMFGDYVNALAKKIRKSAEEKGKVSTRTDGQVLAALLKTPEALRLTSLLRGGIAARMKDGTQAASLTVRHKMKRPKKTYPVSGMLEGAEFSVSDKAGRRIVYIKYNFWPAGTYPSFRKSFIGVQDMDTDSRFREKGIMKLVYAYLAGIHSTEHVFIGTSLLNGGALFLRKLFLSGFLTNVYTPFEAPGGKIDLVRARSLLEQPFMALSKEDQGLRSEARGIDETELAGLMVRANLDWNERPKLEAALRETGDPGVIDRAKERVMKIFRESKAGNLYENLLRLAPGFSIAPAAQTDYRALWDYAFLRPVNERLTQLRSEVRQASVAEVRLPLTPEGIRALRPERTEISLGKTLRSEIRSKEIAPKAFMSQVADVWEEVNQLDLRSEPAPLDVKSVQTSKKGFVFIGDSTEFEKAVAAWAGLIDGTEEGYQWMGTATENLRKMDYGKKRSFIQNARKAADYLGENVDSYASQQGAIVADYDDSSGTGYVAVLDRGKGFPVSKSGALDIALVHGGFLAQKSEGGGDGIAVGRVIREGDVTIISHGQVAEIKKGETVAREVPPRLYDGERAQDIAKFKGAAVIVRFTVERSEMREIGSSSDELAKTDLEAAQRQFKWWSQKIPAWTEGEKEKIPQILKALYEAGFSLRGGTVQLETSEAGARVVFGVLGTPRTPSSVYNKTLQVYKDRGGWDAALREAGLDPESIKREPGFIELRNMKNGQERKWTAEEPLAVWQETSHAHEAAKILSEDPATRPETWNPSRPLARINGVYFSNLPVAEGGAAVSTAILEKRNRSNGARQVVGIFKEGSSPGSLDLVIAPGNHEHSRLADAAGLRRGEYFKLLFGFDNKDKINSLMIVPSFSYRAEAIHDLTVQIYRLFAAMPREESFAVQVVHSAATQLLDAIADSQVFGAAEIARVRRVAPIERQGLVESSFLDVMASLKLHAEAEVPERFRRSEMREDSFVFWTGHFAGGRETSVAPVEQKGYEDFWRRFFSKIPSGSRALDLGAGNLFVTRQAMEAGKTTGKTFDLWALDAAMIKPERVPQGVRLVRARGEDLDKTDIPEDLDVVVSQYGLEYMDREKVLSRLAQKMKPGAKAFFIMHRSDSGIIQNARLGLREFAQIHEAGVPEAIREFLKAPVFGEDFGEEGVSKKMVRSIEVLNLLAAEKEPEGGSILPGIQFALENFEEACRTKTEGEKAIEGLRVFERSFQRAEWLLKERIRAAMDQEGMERFVEEAGWYGFRLLEPVVREEASAVSGWQVSLEFQPEGGFPGAVSRSEMRVSDPNAKTVPMDEILKEEALQDIGPMEKPEVMQEIGGRSAQEDHVLVMRVAVQGVRHGKGQLLAVMDGHGGDEAAAWIEQEIRRSFEPLLRKSNSLVERLFRRLSQKEEGTVETAFRGLHKKLDAGTAGMTAGATLCLIYIPDDEKAVYAMTVGDSTAVLRHESQELPAIHEHNVQDPQAREEHAKKVSSSWPYQFILKNGLWGLVFFEFSEGGGEALSYENQVLRSYGDRALRKRGLNVHEPWIGKILLPERGLVSALVATDGIHMRPDVPKKERDLRLRKVMVSRTALKSALDRAALREGSDNVTAVYYRWQPGAPPPARSEARGSEKGPAPVLSSKRASAAPLPDEATQGGRPGSLDAFRSEARAGSLLPRPEEISSLPTVMVEGFRYTPQAIFKALQQTEHFSTAVILLQMLDRQEQERFLALLPEGFQRKTRKALFVNPQGVPLERVAVFLQSGEYGARFEGPLRIGITESITDELIHFEVQALSDEGVLFRIFYPGEAPEEHFLVTGKTYVVAREEDPEVHLEASELFTVENDFLTAGQHFSFSVYKKGNALFFKVADHGSKNGTNVSAMIDPKTVVYPRRQEVLETFQQKLDDIVAREPEVGERWTDKNETDHLADFKEILRRAAKLYLESAEFPELYAKRKEILQRYFFINLMRGAHSEERAALCLNYLMGFSDDDSIAVANPVFDEAADYVKYGGRVAKVFETDKILKTPVWLRKKIVRSLAALAKAEQKEAEASRTAKLTTANLREILDQEVPPPGHVRSEARGESVSASVEEIGGGTGEEGFVLTPEDPALLHLKLAEQLNFTQQGAGWDRANLRILSELEAMPLEKYVLVVDVARRVVHFLNYKGEKKKEIFAAGRRFFDRLHGDLLLDPMQRQPKGLGEAGSVPDAITQMRRNVAKYPIMNELGQMKHGVLLKLGEETSREILIVSNYRLIADLVLQYARNGGDIGYLWGSAHIAAVRATETFNPTKGKKFSGWLQWYVENALKREGLRSQWMIDLPPAKREMISKYRDAIHRANEFNSDDPEVLTIDPYDPEVTDETIAAAIQWPVETVRQAREALKLNPVSLDAPLGDEKDAADRYEVVAAKAPEGSHELPREILETIATIFRKTAWLMLLSGGWEETALVRDVKILRGVLAKPSGTTLDQIAGSFGLTATRLKQICSEVLPFAREAVKQLGLADEDLIEPGEKLSALETKAEDRVEKLLAEARRSRQGAALLAKHAGISPDRFSVELVFALPEEDWAVLKHYYGIGVPATQNYAAMKTLLRNEGFEFASVAAIIDCRMKAIRRLGQAKTSRERMLLDLRRADPLFQGGIEQLPDGILRDFPALVPEKIQEELATHYGLGRHRVFTRNLPDDSRAMERHRKLILKRLAKYLRAGADGVAYQFVSKRFAGYPPMKDGREILAYEMGESADAVTQARLFMWSPKQLAACDGWYGLTGLPKSTEEILEIVNSEELRSAHVHVKSAQGKMTPGNLSAFVKEARLFLSKYTDGWAWCAADLGMEVGALKRKFPGLPERQQTILKDSFGIDGPMIPSDEAIGEKYGLTARQVNQEKYLARKFLRSEMRGKGVISPESLMQVLREKQRRGFQKRQKRWKGLAAAGLFGISLVVLAAEQLARSRRPESDPDLFRGAVQSVLPKHLMIYGVHEGDGKDLFEKLEPYGAFLDRGLEGGGDPRKDVVLLLEGVTHPGSRIPEAGGKTLLELVMADPEAARVHYAKIDEETERFLNDQANREEILKYSDQNPGNWTAAVYGYCVRRGIPLRVERVPYDVWRMPMLTAGRDELETEDLTMIREGMTRVPPEFWERQRDRLESYWRSQRERDRALNRQMEELGRIFPHVISLRGDDHFMNHGEIVKGLEEPGSLGGDLFPVRKAVARQMTEGRVTDTELLRYNVETRMALPFLSWGSFPGREGKNRLREAMGRISEAVLLADEETLQRFFIRGILEHRRLQGETRKAVRELDASVSALLQTISQGHRPAGNDPQLFKISRAIKTLVQEEQSLKELWFERAQELGIHWESDREALFREVRGKAREAREEKLRQGIEQTILEFQTSRGYAGREGRSEARKTFRESLEFSETHPGSAGSAGRMSASPEEDRVLFKDIGEVLFSGETIRGIPTYDDDARKTAGALSELFFESELVLTLDWRRLSWTKPFSADLIQRLSQVMVERSRGSFFPFGVESELESWDLMKMISELFKNASDAYAAADREGKVHFKILRDGENLIFEVSDDGIGYGTVAGGRAPWEMQRFKFSKNGMGLYLVGEFARAQGGAFQMIVPGVDGHRTTARLTLPSDAFSQRIERRRTGFYPDDTAASGKRELLKKKEFRSDAVRSEVREKGTKGGTERKDEVAVPERRLSTIALFHNLGKSGEELSREDSYWVNRRVNGPAYSKEVVEYNYGDVLAKLRELLGELRGKNLVEIGCGDGMLLRYLSEEYGMNVRGLEKSQFAVDLARTENGLAGKVWGDDEDSHIPDGFADVVLSVRVFEPLVLSEYQALGIARRTDRMLKKRGLQLHLTSDAPHLNALVKAGYRQVQSSGVSSSGHCKHCIWAYKLPGGTVSSSPTQAFPGGDLSGGTGREAGRSRSEMRGAFREYLEFLEAHSRDVGIRGLMNSALDYWAATDDNARIFDAVADKGGLFVGVGWGGQNESYLWHMKAAEALIIDNNPYITDLRMPLVGALVLDSSDRIEFLSKITARPLTPVQHAAFRELSGPALSTAFEKIRFVPDYFRESSAKVLDIFPEKMKPGIEQLLRQVAQAPDFSMKTLEYLGNLYGASPGGRNSWLLSDEAFAYIQKMWREGRIRAVRADWDDSALLGLHDFQGRAAAVFLSNLLTPGEFIRDHGRFAKNIRFFSNRETALLDMSITKVQPAGAVFPDLSGEPEKEISLRSENRSETIFKSPWGYFLALQHAGWAGKGPALVAGGMLWVSGSEIGGKTGIAAKALAGLVLAKPVYLSFFYFIHELGHFMYEKWIRAEPEFWFDPEKMNTRVYPGAQGHLTLKHHRRIWLSGSLTSFSAIALAGVAAGLWTKDVFSAALIGMTAALEVRSFLSMDGPSLWASLIDPGMAALSLGVAETRRWRSAAEIRVPAKILGEDLAQRSEARHETQDYLAGAPQGWTRAGEREGRARFEAYRELAGRLSFSVPVEGNVRNAGFEDVYQMLGGRRESLSFRSEVRSAAATKDPEVEAVNKITSTPGLSEAILDLLKDERWLSADFDGLFVVIGFGFKVRNNLKVIAEALPRARVLGIDYRQDVVGKAQSEIAGFSETVRSRIRVEQGNARNLRDLLGNGTAGAVYFESVFSLYDQENDRHQELLHEMIRESHRVLRPGGLLVVSDAYAGLRSDKIVDDLGFESLFRQGGLDPLILKKPLGQPDATLSGGVEKPGKPIASTWTQSSNEAREGRSEMRQTVRAAIENMKGRFAVVTDMADVAEFTDKQLEEFEVMAHLAPNVRFVFYGKGDLILRSAQNDDVLQRIEQLQSELGADRIVITESGIEGLALNKGEKVISISKGPRATSHGPREKIFEFRYVGEETGLVPMALLYADQHEKPSPKGMMDLSMVSELLRAEIRDFQNSIVFARAA